VNSSSPVVAATSEGASTSASGDGQRYWKQWILVAAALVALAVVLHQYRSLLFTSIGDLGHQKKFAAIKGTSDQISIVEMFEMQMLMNNLSQLSEMSTSIVSASNSAISSMARNVKS